MTARERFVSWALSQVRQSVLWAGRGESIFDSVTRKLRPSGYAEPVFDCSGLVACALIQAGGPDLRGTHNAQMMHDATETNPAITPQAGELVFYGASPSGIVHVAITLNDGACISADGATRRITSLDVAKKAGARVRVHDVLRYRSERFFTVHRNRWVDELDRVC